MGIRILYFASLRETTGRVEETISAEDLLTLGAICKLINHGQPLPEQVLCAVNRVYANATTTIQDGDEVAFFPPVTGG